MRSAEPDASRLLRIPSLGLALTFLVGCPDPPAPPPAFEPCGAVTISVRGRMGLGSLAPRDINTRGELDEDSTTVTWTVNSTATGTVLDGATASGATTHDPQTDDRTFNTTGSSGNHTIAVSGTVKADCTGSGNWRVSITASGQMIGRGTWTTN